MELQARLVQVLPVQSGVSSKTGNPWKRQSFIVETDGQYPRKICIGLFGEDKVDVSTFAPGTLLNVSFDIESREFNGRWYTDIRAWRVEVAQSPVNAPVAPVSAAPAAGAADPQPFSAGREPSTDDLPF